MTRQSLRSVLGRRVLVADGAMGTMLQRQNLDPTDFQGYEGCNEMLNLTRPDVVGEVHRQYFAAGADLVTTNTFGANFTALAEYSLETRIEELAEMGALIARQVADAMSTPRRTRWVLGSMGPGTKLPTLGQVGYTQVRDGYHAQARAMIRGGVDALVVETCQDLLALKAGVVGAKRAVAEAGVDIPIFVSVTLEVGGTMLVGSSLPAVIATVASLGVDLLGLNCSTGPEGMREHLRLLAQESPLSASCMPNAGMPELTEAGAVYALGPKDFADQVASFVEGFGLALVGGCCGTTPDHISALVQRVKDLSPQSPAVVSGGQVASLYSAIPLAQDVSYLAIGERTNASGSKAFREAMLAGDWDACVDIARDLASEGAHVLDVCVDYVGRDGREDMAELLAHVRGAVDSALMIDSSSPEVLIAGLEQCPGRAIVNSVHFESGEGEGSKFATIMEAVVEHGAAVVGLCIDEEGQARTLERKLEVAYRLISRLTGDYGMSGEDILIDCLTFPIGTGQEDTRHDAAATIEAIRSLRSDFPTLHLTLGVSNVSFGLKPAARVVLNSVFLDECRRAGLDAAIVSPTKILPLASIPEQQVQAALDLIWARDPEALDRYLALFEGVKTVSAVRLEQLPVLERVRQHVIAGVSSHLGEDLAEALRLKSAADLINDDLLNAMREVGERFGSGKMQLPFVLKSAEVMKAAVSHLEPHLAKGEETQKGTIVLATVRGDVHDIGKNLVDIILSNNGYKVVNLGIKQPISSIISAAESSGADAIGMSGLLVKSTQIMKENLQELDAQGLGTKYPVLLGGAALTRKYVEKDLTQAFSGEVRYAKDAFAGLTIMDELMARDKTASKAISTEEAPVVDTAPPTPPTEARLSIKRPHSRPLNIKAGPRSHVARPIPGQVDVPTPPFWGVWQGQATLDEIMPWLDERSLFAGQWELRPGPEGPTYEELVETQGLPRLEMWLDRALEEGLFSFEAMWGYWPCHSEGDDLVVEGRRKVRFTFPRQPAGAQLCLSDYFRDAGEAREFGSDVVAFQVVTAGPKVSGHTSALFAAHKYRDYFELHGLSVQLTEAMAEMWHARIRMELGLPELTDDINEMIGHQRYTGERFSFGYPACPDLSQRRLLVNLLEAERIGVILSEEDQLHPEQSTDALIVHHPEAHYFSVGSRA
ncbi:MAG: methionine synthase [Propionibacteriaceae bacterium]|jgi:5-methyltetrahydrofolate--homocysteine methyltransferase|nr:methionine synthase [Propionibacteriaceae bacterium]